MDIAIGEVALNLNEELLPKKKNSSDTASRPDEAVGSTVESDIAKKPEKKPLALVASKFTPLIPEKVSWFSFMAAAHFLDLSLPSLVTYGC